MSTKRLLFTILALFLLPGATALAQETGRLEGRVTVDGGGGIGGVSVVIHAASLATITDGRGYFALARVPAGTHSVTFTMGDNSATQEGVEVTAGMTAELEMAVDWKIGLAESVVVYSASRRVERIVDAPAAVTVINEQQIEREAAHGQIPKLLEFTPGAEVTQSGIYDYNFNTRGLNSSLNRRVATLIDGRDPSVPFLGAQEWAAISFPLDDLSSIELVRGPSAALYGANASSGVLNLTSKQPRYSEGGQIRFAAGELSTTNVDFRWAGGFGSGWYAKVTAGVRNSGDFSVSRQFPPGAAEYSVPCPFPQGTATDCLPQELAPLARVDDNDITFGGVRLDKYLSNGSVLTFEGGTASLKGPVFQTGIGRVQLVDVERPWGRFNYSADHFNVLAYYNKRDASEQLALASGANLALDTNNVQIEVQTNWEFAGGDARIVGGAAYGEEEIDSFDPNRPAAIGGPGQSLIFQPVDADFKALFAQLDWDFSERLKLVVAGRWDESSLHDSQLSPKASLVFSIDPNNTLRFTYNEAFQVANYSEFFLQAPVAAPQDLSAIEGICTLEGVDCGFGNGATPILAVGNKSLQLEEVQTFELGYSGIFRGATFLTIDYYNSNNENFITDLIPQIDSMTGAWTNPNFLAYTPPAALSPVGQATLVGTLMGALGPSFAILSNNLDGSPIFTAVSYTNFGEVDTQGIDLGINHYFNDHWSASFAYSWFDFEIKDPSATFASQLLPNSPEGKASGGVNYRSGKFDGGISARWVDDFRWAVGPFQGMVQSYTTIDLNANFTIDENWSAGINVANATDDDHYEAFGGDLLARRALGHVTFSWR